MVVSISISEAGGELVRILGSGKVDLAAGPLMFDSAFGAIILLSKEKEAGSVWEDKLSPCGSMGSDEDLWWYQGGGARSISLYSTW